DRLPEGSRERTNLDIVMTASHRARDLVKQILAFSRKEQVERRTIVLADLVRETITMLRASLPATIAIEQSLEPVPQILGDPGQLHQVILNIVTNAAYAIGEAHGRIAVALGPVEATNASTSDAGPEVRLVIRDT